MRAGDLLRELGRPIAYFPFLSRYLGGVNASVLFCQLFYWQDKATSELGVHKTVEELESETGLSYEEQRAARALLRERGVLVETSKRIEHKTYFRIDEDALERLLSVDPTPKKQRKPRGKKSGEAAGKSQSPEMGKVHLGRLEKSSSGNGKSPSREMDKSDAPNWENPDSRDGENHARGEGNSQVVNDGVITAETTAAATRASATVDNSAAAAADEKNAAPQNRERELTDLLIALEADRGKTLAVDQADRIHVIAWIGDELTDDELREAQKRAAKARVRDRDDRPAYVAYVAQFVREVLAARSAADGGTAEWWLGNETQVCNEGHRLGVRPKKPDEPLPVYRAMVARAAGKGPWIDAILRDAERVGGLYLQTIVTTIGERLLPIDWCAQ